MKVVVYAISKNEEKFAQRWIDSMKEADEIYVLDSFSTDKTKDILEANNVKVIQQKIEPWRFDEARNVSLSLIPNDADICVCTDLDEVFTKGWREQVEKFWINGQTIQASYNYVWNHLENGENGVMFNIEKIHSRHGFKWENPVHEVLNYCGSEKITKIHIPNICLQHYADNSKPRTSYLPLLELAIKENPNNDRNMHYLGREYYFYGQHDKSISTLKKHLKMPNSTWNEERCASLRYISKNYQAKGKIRLAIKYLKLACIECPNSREPRLELAILYYSNEKYYDALISILDLLKINRRTYSYISLPECWNSLPHDIASICYFKLKDYSNALAQCEEALLRNNADERLINNKKIILNYINQRK